MIVWFNPSVTACHLPYILLRKTQRRRVRCISLSLLFRFYTCHPVMLRGTAMEEFKIFEATLLNLFPCAAQRYRGSAHRARGLVLQKNPMCFFFNPSLRRCRSSVSPLYCCAIQGRRGEYSQRTEKIKRPFKATHLILSLCIATIDIGGSARRAKGLKQNLQESQ